MMKKRTFLLLSILVSCCSHELLSNLTTMQHWDPSPIYAANNYLMPPNSYMVNMRKARKKNMRPDNNFHFGISLSGFAQGACKAYDSAGCDAYQAYCGEDMTLASSQEFQMGNFRGTINGLALFLGNDPTGKSIWDSTATTFTPVARSAFFNPDDTRLLTATSINATQLPPCLKQIALVFAGVTNAATDAVQSDCPATTPTKSQNAFVFNPTTTALPSSGVGFPTYIPSIFSDTLLGARAGTVGTIGTNATVVDSPTFFGTFSLPLDYKKYGLRIELAGEYSDWLGFTIQTGFVNIQQTTRGLFSLSQADYDSANPTRSLYGQLSQTLDPDGTASAPPPNATAQGYFNDYFANNIQEIFDSECGLDISTCNFDAYSVEDIRFILSFKHTYDLDRYTARDNDNPNWSDMLFTPYAWVGASAPVAKEQCYKKLLSLPFGNNGHASVGGGVGFMFDFLDSVEVGFEGGGTYFVPRSIHRPVPNHPLQRVVYPYYTDVNVEPGFNWHLKANMNAYQFMNHISFWATYEFIEHKKDRYCLCNNANNTVTKTLSNVIIAASPDCSVVSTTSLGTKEEQIFYPELLNCNSAWRAQFIDLALVFDIQPGMQASFVWQQPISPRNAYYPITLMGTFTFMF